MTPAPALSDGPRPLLSRLRGAVIEVGRPPERFRLEVEAFDLAVGERVALVGPSGSGKSLLLEVLALIRRPATAARFALRVPEGGQGGQGGQSGSGGLIDVAALWERGSARLLARARRRAVGFLLQSGGLLPFLSVAENVRLPARLAGTDPAAATDLLAGLGLAGLERRRPGSLSGGQRQRAALARAASARPGLLLADEPTSALDARTADAVLTLVTDLVRAGRVGTAVIATHDLARARDHGFETLALEVGATADGGVARLAPRRLAA